MPLDPQAKALLDELKAAGAPALYTLSPAEARRRASEMFARFGHPEEVGKVENRMIPGPAGELPVRTYTPVGGGPFPTLVFFHAGGWVVGDLNSHDVLCRTVANAARVLTVSIDYRLAPEHKFPAAVDDCYAATSWVANNAGEIGGDPSRLAVGGDSAGGNLSAVVSLMARDRGGPKISFQMMFYPVTNCADTKSMVAFADGYLLTRADMHCFLNHYLRDAGDRTNPYACPLRASDLRGLPPALVITAEFDPLRDEGEAYAARLKEAGVAVTCTRYDGMIHLFMSMADKLDQGKRAIAQAAECLRSALM